ncbi:MAG: DMT family transporter [Rhodobacteraceae bacterium]|nr:DMT family transporter [Paracoccaceae bacterium]
MMRRVRLMLWWAAAPDNLRGSILMIASFFLFGAMMAGIKAIGTDLPLVQVLFIRQIIVTILLLPLFMRGFPAALRTRYPGLQLVRGAFSLGAMLCGFTALLHIPLADVTALGFAKVLFVTIGAVIVLNESVGTRRWIATAIGFVGVLIMLRPSGEGIGYYYVLTLIGALFGAGITITVRVLAKSERTETILFYQAVFLIVALAVPTLLWWVQPDMRQWALIALVGITGTGGQYLITRAHQTGQASALAPLEFVRLLIATAIGFFIFAEFPDSTTFAGAALVVGATVYTMHRNSARGKPNPAIPPSQ